MGYLLKGSNGRWSIVGPIHGDESNNVELSCGSVIEVQIGGVWIKTRIEHRSADGYYATTKGIKLCDELPARLPE